MRTEAKTRMVEVIEDFERFHLLNLNLTRARTFAADLADRFIRRLGHHQTVTQRHDQTDRCHSQDVFHRCSSFYWADFAFASMLHERASGSRCRRERGSRHRSSRGKMMANSTVMRTSILFVLGCLSLLAAVSERPA